jgi:hypothetical protein
VCTQCVCGVRHGGASLDGAWQAQPPRSTLRVACAARCRAPTRRRPRRLTAVHLQASSSREPSREPPCLEKRAARTWMESAAQRETAACEAGRSSGAAWKPAATPSSSSSVLTTRAMARKDCSRRDLEISHRHVQRFPRCVHARTLLNTFNATGVKVERCVHRGDPDFAAS